MTDSRRLPVGAVTWHSLDVSRENTQVVGFQDKLNQGPEESPADVDVGVWFHGHAPINPRAAKAWVRASALLQSRGVVGLDASSLAVA